MKKKNIGQKCVFVSFFANLKNIYFSWEIVICLITHESQKVHKNEKKCHLNYIYLVVLLSTFIYVLYNYMFLYPSISLLWFDWWWILDRKSYNPKNYLKDFEKLHLANFYNFHRILSLFNVVSLSKSISLSQQY